MTPRRIISMKKLCLMISKCKRLMIRKQEKIKNDLKQLKDFAIERFDVRTCTSCSSWWIVLSNTVQTKSRDLLNTTGFKWRIWLQFVYIVHRASEENKHVPALQKLSLLACFFLDLTQDVEKGGLHAMAVQSMFPKWMCDGKTMHYHMISHKACSQKIDS